MTNGLEKRQATRPALTVGRTQVWREGIKIGIRTIRTAPVLGLKRLLLPVSYWRIAEFAYVWNQLDLTPGHRILDVGSPKELAFMLALNHDVSVVATDILPASVRLSKQYTDALGLSGMGSGKVHSEVQDGRRLGYADNSFDAAFSVSVFEHIPDDGDSTAIGELARVVKPGGPIVVTVPFKDSYTEDWVDRPVYERAQEHDEVVFYQRHYDMSALRARLLAPSGLEVANIGFWGERGIAIERSLNASSLLRRLLSPLEPLLSILFLQPANEKQHVSRMAAFFTLRA